MHMCRMANILQMRPHVDLIGINLTLQKVRIADPDRGIIEYTMDKFKEGMPLNSQPALILFPRNNKFISFFL